MYSEIIFPNFKLNVTQDKDRWLLTKSFEIICVKYIIKTSQNETNVFLYGSVLKTLTDYFEYPVRSSQLNIYQSDCMQNEPTFVLSSDVYCKMVKVDDNHEKSIFIPLYQTIKRNN